MTDEQQHYSAIVLAADRESNNPVAAVAGVRCKSLAPIAGIPMIFRVLDALSAANSIGSALLCGPSRAIIDQELLLNEVITSGKASWMENQATPSLSAFEALKTVELQEPVLLTTSDHALLTSEIVDYFCHAAQQSGCDVVAGVVRRETVLKAYPQTSRTAYRFKDGAYCSCNLFAFLTPQSRTVPTFWRQVEQQRKNPFRVISILGWATVLQYIMGSLSLAEVMTRLSQRLGCKAGAVILPFPEAAIDVDSAEDLHIVENIIKKQMES